MSAPPPTPQNRPTEPVTRDAALDKLRALARELGRAAARAALDKPPP